MREPVGGAHVIYGSGERGNEQTSGDQVLEALKEVEEGLEATISGEETISRDTAVQ